MRTYIYTQDANGVRQVTQEDDPDTIDLILHTAQMIYVIGDRTWQAGSVNPQTGERGGDIRIITLTPAALDMQGHITVMDEVMRVAAPHLRPGGRMWL